MEETLQARYSISLRGRTGQTPSEGSIHLEMDSTSESARLLCETVRKTPRTTVTVEGYIFDLSPHYQLSCDDGAAWVSFEGRLVAEKR